MRTLAEVVAPARPGDVIHLGPDPVLASRVTLPRGCHLTGGTIVGETTIDDPEQVTINGVTFQGVDIPTGSVLQIKGGTAWQLTSCRITGGRAYGQLAINHGRQPPRNWLVEGCEIGGNGVGHPWPQDHSVYILTGSQTPLGGTLRRCKLGPSPGGHVLKIGVTGEVAMWLRPPGAFGVTVEDVEIHQRPADAHVMLIGWNEGLALRRVTSPTPGRLDVLGDTRVDLEDCPAFNAVVSTVRRTGLTAPWSHRTRRTLAPGVNFQGIRWR